MDCSTSLFITNSQSLLKLMSVMSVMPSNHLILSHPLLLPPSIFPSIRVFSSELALHIRWPKYWSFSFSISPSNEYSGLISFGIDWLDLLAAQGTLKSLLQHHNLKASIIRCSAFFIVQLSHLYMTIGKTKTDKNNTLQFLNCQSYTAAVQCQTEKKRDMMFLFNIQILFKYYHAFAHLYFHPLSFSFSLKKILLLILIVQTL